MYVNDTFQSSVDGSAATQAQTSIVTGATMIADLFRRNFRKRVRDAVRHFLEAIDN